MLANVATMQADEYVNIIGPIVNPMIQVEGLSNEITNIEKKVKTDVSSAKTKPFWLSILYGMLFAFVFFICGMIQAILVRTLNMAVFTNLLMIVFLSTTFIMFVYLKIVAKRKVRKIKLEYSLTQNKLVNQRNNITNRVYGVLNQYVPHEYWYSFALGKIVGYLSNGRATNPMQAFNLFEEEMHRARMEKMQNDILVANQRQVFFSAVSAIANVSTASSVSNINSRLG